jgi:predicted O-methyltransferase YrrM
LSQDTWTAVDRYITDRLIAPDPVLDDVLRESDSAGLPTIQVAPNQGKLLHLLALAIGARRILEIGTLGGYSTIWLARALPAGGRLISLEALPVHAEVARANLSRAGLDGVVEVRVGRAIDSLQQLADEGAETFDLVFIDADTLSTPDYFGWALRLTRPGGLIIVDNVVRKGGLVDSAADDPDTRAVRRLYEVMGAEPRVSATAIQTVGIKGHDGFALALVLQ